MEGESDNKKVKHPISRIYETIFIVFEIAIILLYIFCTEYTKPDASSSLRMS